MAMKSARLAMVAGLAMTIGGATLVVGQNSAGEAADAAEMVAADAETAIRAIDPTTGGDSLVIDPSLPDPYGPLDEELPKLPSAPMDLAEAPRGPAARMISDPQVQDLPEPAPAPGPAPAQASNDPFVIKSILPIEGTIRYGEWFWDESRAPASGPLVITVDLDARVISAFRGGHEIGTAVALLGTTSHPTPLGTFPILTKEKDNISEKYNNAPMPWTLRLTWDGIAIHGSPVMNGYASHGCIGVPDPFAEKLFAAARRGDKVIITRGQFIGVGDKLVS
jgi:lipoprotein-anchoring transpeptidase ErfK/SrfK